MKNYKNCIYRLYLEGDDRSYIGSTKDANSRLRCHLQGLLKNTHTNKLLQLAFNKHGYLAYKWEILESDIKPSKLLEREHYYIKLNEADTKGFNQATVTGNSKNNKQYIPDEIKYNNQKYIEWWLKNKKIEFKEIKFSTNIRIIDNNSYSKFWWNNLSESDLKVVVTNIYNYIRNISKCRVITSMMICGGEEKIEQNKEMNLTVFRLINKFRKQPYTNKKMKDVIVASALNPLHTEMMYMSQEEVNEYRVAKLFRLLEDCNLEDNIVIHLPQKYFKEMLKIVKNYRSEIS